MCKSCHLYYKADNQKSIYPRVVTISLHPETLAIFVARKMVKKRQSWNNAHTDL